MLATELNCKYIHFHSSTLYQLDWTDFMPTLVADPNERLKERATKTELKERATKTGLKNGQRKLD
jgi:hypothetical protein